MATYMVQKCQFPWTQMLSSAAVDLKLWMVIRYIFMFASMYWLELVNNGVLAFLAIFWANVPYYCAAHVYHYHVTLYAIIVPKWI
jgi:hypothetical protein